MATEDIKIVINADDKASGVLANLGKNAGSLGSALKGLGAIAGTAVVAGFGAMAAFGISSVKAFIEAEKEMAVANTALQNTIEAMNGKQLEELNKTLGITGSSFVGMQKAMEDVGKSAVKLGFDDESASVAFAKLFQVTQNVTQAQDDLKLAMDLAAFSGRGLEESAGAITKVHAGATRILKEFGIELKDNATEADALAALQERVTGSAAAMADTTAGKLQVLSVSWQNLKETVGASLAEAIGPFITQLTEWSQKPETQEKLQEISKELANFVKQMTPIITQVLPVFIQLLEISGKTLLKVATFLFKDLPNAIATAIVAIDDLINRITDFIIKIENALRKLKEFITTGQYSSSGASLNPFSSSFKLPGFADGGVVGGPLGAPTLAVVHGGETVVPPGKSFGGFGGININITGTFLSEDAAEKMASLMIDQLKLELRI